MGNQRGGEKELSKKKKIIFLSSFFWQSFSLTLLMSQIFWALIAWDKGLATPKSLILLYVVLHVMGHIHNQGTQKKCLTKKGLQRIILDVYNIYCL
jgi:hypothetical protein